MKKIKIICFGEVLWDMLPTGKLPGGAPMNVAYHLNALGVSTDIISRVGKDDLGAELLDFLTKKHIPVDLIQHDAMYSTGVVNVELDEQGSPSYQIERPVAWDNILLTNALLKIVADADAIVYGSLVCRNEASQNTLFELLKIAKRKIFDVNIREPFYEQLLIEHLMSEAQIVKMNEHELELISGWYNNEKDFSKQMHFLQKRFDLETLIVSQGSVGAYCLENNQLFFQKSFKIIVKDTIGSGDAFLAGFLSEKMHGKSPEECLITACKAGAYVATQAGATPNMNKEVLAVIG